MLNMRVVDVFYLISLYQECRSIVRKCFRQRLQVSIAAIDRDHWMQLKRQTSAPDHVVQRADAVIRWTHWTFVFQILTEITDILTDTPADSFI